MGLVSKMGKTLFNAGAKAVKTAAKNPKATIAAGASALGGYEIGKILSGSNKTEKKSESSSVSTVVKAGLIVAAALVMGTIGKKLLKNPKVSEAVSKLTEKASNLKDLAKNILNKAKKVFKGKTKNINEELQEVIKKATTKSEKIAQKTTEFIKQQKPEGIAKEKLDKVIENFKNHISKIREDRFVFKGTNEEFSKSIEAMYKEFCHKYPEYTDYIKKNMDKFIKKY